MTKLDQTNPYSAAVLARFQQPLYAGTHAQSQAATAVKAASGVLASDKPTAWTSAWTWAWAGDRAQGCEIGFAAQMRAGQLITLRFAAYGCPYAIAAADWAAEHLGGQPLETLRRFRGLDIQTVLAVPPEKLGVLLIVEDALQALANTLNTA